MIVWLISYPRSGNTFTRILTEKVFDLKDSYTIHHQDTTDRALVDVFGREYLKNDDYINLARDSKEIFFVKTHDLPDMKIDVDKDKFIYIVRDGRSSVASYRHFLNDFSKQNKSMKDIILGNVGFGGWGNHVRQWENNFNEINSIVLKYEDITTKPMEMAKIMGNFVGMKIHEAKIPTFEELHKQRPKFFRSGNNEKWREEFSEIDLIQFWLMNFDVMKKYSYGEDIYTDINLVGSVEENNSSTMKILDKLVNISFFSSPFKKYLKYKELAKSYR